MESNRVVTNPWKKPIIWSAVVLLVLIGIFTFGMSRTDLSEAANAYEKNKALAESQGLLFTTEQVEALFKIPESDNGATLVSSVLPVLRELKLDKQKNLTEEVVTSNWSVLEPAIAEIEKASFRKSLIFKRDRTIASATLFPEFSDAKQWVTLLTKIAHFSIQKGDLPNAHRYLDIAGYLGNKMDEEGVLIGFLVRMSCLSIVEREIQETIQTHGKNPAVVKMLGEVLTRLDQPYDMKKPLKFEHWYAVSGIDDFITNDSNFQAMSGTNSIPNEIRFGRLLPRFKSANLSRIHQVYAEGVQSIPEDCYDLVGVQKAFADMDKIVAKPGLSYTLAGIVLPVFAQSGVAMAKEIAQRNVLAQSISLLKGGTDPAEGLPLKGRFALDLDGKPIRLKQTSSGWIVYSIGNDKVDDGGAELKNFKGDYVVHLPK